MHTQSSAQTWKRRLVTDVWVVGRNVQRCQQAAAHRVFRPRTQPQAHCRQTSPPKPPRQQSLPQLPRQWWQARFCTTELQTPPLVVLVRVVQARTVPPLPGVVVPPAAAVAPPAAAAASGLLNTSLPHYSTPACVKKLISLSAAPGRHATKAAAVPAIASHGNHKNHIPGIRRPLESPGSSGGGPAARACPCGAGPAHPPSP